MTTEDIEERKNSTRYKIVLPGGAGLVGQNLVISLKKRGYTDITVIDKHIPNINVMRILHPDVSVIEADLSVPSSWCNSFKGADFVIMLQAQIGSKHLEPFRRNNIESTRNVLSVMKQFSVSSLVHISSSVVGSVVDDYYTNTKKEQENLVVNSGLDFTVLRPTIMFGWFDRKHFGWLSRFMKKSLVFPIPGHGRYMRQPLYVNDFCDIIISCIEARPPEKIYDITGYEKVFYIDIIRAIRRVTKARTIIVMIPYFIFGALLRLWGLFDSNPPFTFSQLEALVAKDEFDVIPWTQIFNVQHTSFESAIKETFMHPIYSNYELKF